MKDVQRMVLDLAESKLLEKIRSGNLTAIIFYLKTKGKHRGYIERLDQQKYLQEQNAQSRKYDFSQLSEEELDQLEALHLKAIDGDTSKQEARRKHVNKWKGEFSDL